MPMSTMPIPRRTRLRAANAKMRTYEATRSPKPNSCQCSFGIVTYSSTTWIARPANSTDRKRQRTSRSRVYEPLVTSGIRGATTTTIAYTSTGSMVREYDPELMLSEVLYENAAGIARVTINRPERCNAMSFGVMQGLRQAVARARDDDEVRVVVITG